MSNESQQQQQQQQTTSTNLATLKAGELAKAKQPTNPVAAALMKAHAAMKSVLPAHLTPERMSRLALGTLRTNKQLAAAAKKNPESFAKAVVEASQLGLEVGVMGQAYLVPYNDKRNDTVEVQMIPGYRGLLSLVRRSGEVSSVSVEEVYEKDEFEMELGLNAKLIHKPYLKGDRGAFVLAYMVAHFKDGSHHIEWMGAATIDSVRSRSKAKDSGPWVSDTSEMRRKTVVRRGCKYLPMSVELANAVALAEAADEGKRAALDGEFVIVADDDDDGSSSKGDGGVSKAGADTAKQVTDKSGGVQDGGSGIPDPNADDLIRQLQAVKSKEAADAILDLANGLPADAKARVKHSYDNRLEVLRVKPDGGPKGSSRKASSME